MDRAVLLNTVKASDVTKNTSTGTMAWESGLVGKRPLLTALYGITGNRLQSCQNSQKVFYYNARMDMYQLTAQKRLQKQQEVVAQRREKAWRLAKTAAALLQEEFGATQVAVFGSLLQPQLFHRRSDVDLAVWGWMSDTTGLSLNC